MTAEDLELVLAWRNHPDVRAMMYTQDEISPETHNRWFIKALENERRHLLIFMLNGIPSGFVNIGELDCGHIADWGFYRAPEAPRGIGHHLGQAAIAYAFGTLGLHKLCGQVLRYNERSVRVHVSLGFRQEGILRDQHFQNDCYHDVICFGLLRQEWQAH